MRLLIILCCLLSSLSISVKGEGEKPIPTTFENPLGIGADPWVTKVKGLYYTCRSTGRGLEITESPYLSKIEKSQLVWNCPEKGWNAHNIWAPEIHFIQRKWYIYYAAGEKGGAPFIHQRSGVLEASQPFGPYTDKGMLKTGNSSKEESIWAIDLHPFTWKGKLYAVWSGWEKPSHTDQTAQCTYIAEMKNPWTLKQRHLISKAELDWELGAPFGLQEGQTSLKNDDNLFIVYSTRGSWTKEYKLGALKLKKDQDPLNATSWEKLPQPVFQGNETVHGVGHASFTQSPDGKEHWIYYHTKRSVEPGWDRDIRLQSFTFDKSGNPNFSSPVQAGSLTRPSGEHAKETRLQRTPPSTI